MLLLAFGAFAQIEGDVADQKNKGVPDAIIIATDLARKVADTVKSDKRGFYEFKGLKPGKYIIEVKAAGFQSSTQKNVVVNEEDTGAPKGEEDLYWGQRLNITLTSAKVLK
jgi:hypothetical protein